MKVKETPIKYTTTCSRCKSKLEFEKTDFIEKDYTSSVICPICANEICVRKVASVRGVRQKVFNKEIEAVYSEEDSKRGPREKKHLDVGYDYFLDNKKINDKILGVQWNYATERGVSFSQIYYEDGHEEKVESKRLRTLRVEKEEVHEK